MSSPLLHDGVWPRAARLLATILLLGGMGAGPAAHRAAEADVASSSTCDAGHDHGIPGSPQPVPDPHHDCPVCITLATATPSVLPAMPSAGLTDAHAMPGVGSTLADGGAADLSRARAPPIA